MSNSSMMQSTGKHKTQHSSFSKSVLGSSDKSLYEGGSEDAHPDQQDYQEDDQYEYDDAEIDPDDPYQINQLHEIDHDTLKEMYTQVVDELLDLQLEFEEKLVEVEEQAAADLEKQREELEQEN